MALWLYLHFDALQLDSLAKEQSAEQPVVVVDVQQHQVLQLNQQARSCGIQPQMGLASAAALCPQLQVLAYQPLQQLNILQSVAQQVYQVSADIALDPPDGLFLRLTNMLQLYAGLTGYWQQLTGQLAQSGHHYHYGCGISPYAAKCLAKQQANWLSDQPQRLQQALHQSPLLSTELTPQQQQQLARLGINQLGQLLALSPAELTRRFEPGLLVYLGRLRGDLHHSMAFYQPQQQFSRYLELLYDIKTTSVLLQPLRSILVLLEQQLRLSDSLTDGLTLQLFFRDKDPLTLQIGSAQGEYKAAVWQRLCELQLESIKLPAPVYALQLQVSHFFLQQAQNRALFDEKKASLSALQLLSQLQARLGRDSVKGLALANQCWPEQASQHPLPLLAKPTTGIAALPLRPAFLLAQPEPLSEVPEIRYGPERWCVDGDEQLVQRDYFIGRSARGQWLWLFRTPENHWYIHGLFS